MPEKPAPVHEEVVEREYINEGDFLHLMYQLINQLLEQAGMFEGKANQLFSQAQHLKNTLEAVELAKQTGHRVKYFKDEEGGIGYMPIKKQPLGFI